MDPKVLLNPKAYVKERPKKRTPNYGPKQARKTTNQASTTTVPKLVSYDPKALLNPKGSSGRAATSKMVEEDDDNFSKQQATSHESTSIAELDQEDNARGMSSMLEQQYGIVSRETPLGKRRKIETIADGDSDEDRRKSKSIVNIASNGGVLSAHMQAERKSLAEKDAQTTETVDLTNEEEEDEDVTFVTKEEVDRNTEVCLGRIPAEANVHRIPYVPKNRINTLGSDKWPQIRVAYKCPTSSITGRNSVINLYDRPNGEGNLGSHFANVEARKAAPLCHLFSGAGFHKIRVKIFVEENNREPGEHVNDRVSRRFAISIVLYARKGSAEGIGKFLSARGLFLEKPKIVDRDVEVINPHDPKDFTPKGAKRKQGTQAVYGVQRTQEEVTRQAQSMIDELVKKTSDLPEMETDNNIITTELYSHQKQALYFMTRAEKMDDELPEDASRFSLWQPRDKKRGRVWYNVITNQELETKPPPVRGGILADMMGLGKTLSLLALHTATLPEAADFGKQEPSLDMEDVSCNARATLIICPKSVLANWDEQIRLHTKKGKYKVYTYHGSQRTQDLDELAKYDFILTPYGTVAAEFSDRVGGRRALASINWFRIILDEAHEIRTETTQTSGACRKLQADRRWAVTGTPVQNRLEDLGTLIKFLRIKPFDEGNSWIQHIIMPLRTIDPSKASSENVFQHLRLLVDGIMLRRTKEKIGLGKREETRSTIDFTFEERAVYEQFAKTARFQFNTIQKSKLRLQGRSYAHVLKSITRLRMLCAHGREMLTEDDCRELEGLIQQDAIDLGDDLDPDSPEQSFWDPKDAYGFLDRLVDNDSNTCTLCDRPVEIEEGATDETVSVSDDDESEAEAEAELGLGLKSNESTPRQQELPAVRGRDVLGSLTPCYHLICPKCTDVYIKQSEVNMRADRYYDCPHCQLYQRFDLFELKQSAFSSFLAARNDTSARNGRARWDETTYSGPHSKVKALLEDLRQSAIETANLPPGEPPIRSVVFSGWTSYLDLIEYALDLEKVGYIRLDGSMTLKARSAVLQTFKSDPNVTVLLVSIKAGGQGLNFTAANHVYMMEPQFNPGVEQQAIDRVHRLGQTRDVKIVHYIMRDSIEGGIIGLQEKKEKLATLAVGKGGARGARSAGVMEVMNSV